MKNHITVRYAENGKCILNFQQEEMVATLDITNTPQLQTSSAVLLPGRTLAVIQVNSELKPEKVARYMKFNLMRYCLKSIQISTLYR